MPGGGSRCHALHDLRRISCRSLPSGYKAWKEDYDDDEWERLGLFGTSFGGWVRLRGILYRSLPSSYEGWKEDYDDDGWDRLGGWSQSWWVGLDNTILGGHEAPHGLCFTEMREFIPVT